MITEVISVSDDVEFSEETLVETKELRVRVGWLADTIQSIYTCSIGYDRWCGRVLGLGVQHGVLLPHYGGSQEGVQCPLFNPGEGDTEDCWML